MKKVFYVILARGGSKGLPGKNKMSLLGKPLLAYSIETALASKYCCKVIVSTDDEEIAEIARLHGAEVPFLRPAELATDTSTSAEAVLHALSHYENLGEIYDLIVLLEPTSPIREAEDLDAAINMVFNNDGATSCVSISRLESGHPRFLFNLDDQFRLSSYLDQNNVVRRQDLEGLYYPEGSFYIAVAEEYKKKKTFYQDNLTIGFELEKWKSFEIDTYEDFLIVEAIMKADIKKRLADI